MIPSCSNLLPVRHCIDLSEANAAVLQIESPTDFRAALHDDEFMRNLNP